MPPPNYALVSTFMPVKVLMVDFQNKGLAKKKIFVVPDEALYFSEALGFSLPSLLLNPALVVIEREKYLGPDMTVAQPVFV